MTREYDTLEERQTEKADERGGFTDRIVLERVGQRGRSPLTADE